MRLGIESCLSTLLANVACVRCLARQELPSRSLQEGDHLLEVAGPVPSRRHLQIRSIVVHLGNIHFTMPAPLSYLNFLLTPLLFGAGGLSECCLCMDIFAQAHWLLFTSHLCRQSPNKPMPTPPHLPIVISRNPPSTPHPPPHPFLTHPASIPHPPSHPSLAQP